MGVGMGMTLHNLAPLPMVNPWLKRSLPAVAAGLLGVVGLALGAQSRAQSVPLLPSVPKTPATPALTAPAGQPMQHNHHHHHQNNNNHNGHNHEVGPAGRSYDLRWLDAMVQHHTGALRMSEYVFDIGVPGVGTLAKEIWRDQAQEIKAMGQWRKAWFPEAPVYPVALAPGGDPDTMAGLVRMSGAQIAAMRMMESTPNRDNRVPWFLEGMLQHHGGALLMAHDALAKSLNPDLRRLAAARAAAEKRAQQLKCSGAFAMGDQWMPCQDLSSYEKAISTKK
jgi:uncharacterized protein (DUF305 family)